MVKRRKKISLKFILPLFLLFLFLIFISLFKFKDVNFKDKNLSSYLQIYFENKSLIEIIVNAKKIMNDFPEIVKLEIKPNIFKRKIELNIETAKIVAKICDLKKCYFLDNFSRIIEPKILIKNNLIKITSYLPLEKNSLLNPKLTNSLSLIFEYSNWKPLILKEIKIYSNFDIGIFDEQNRQFLFDPNKDIEEQIKKLHLFLTKNFKGSRIDLRISKKIYYK